MPNTSRPRPDDKERTARAQEQEFKRARGAISCAECRRLKLKCDKTVPCSSCKRRGCSSICPNGSLTTGQGTRFILADTDRLHRKIAEMSDRIRQLEDALALLQSSVTRDAHPLLDQDLLRIKSGLELHSAANTRLREGVREEEDEEDEEESQYIDSFGTLAVRDDGAATFYGRSAGSESLLLDERAAPAPMPASRPSGPRTMLPPALTRLTTAFPSAPTDMAALDAQELMEEHLPPWPRAAQLCDLYLEQAPWFFGAVTRRQLVQEVLPLFYEEAAAGAADSGAFVQGGAGLSSSAAAFNLQEARSMTGTGTAHDLALLFVIFCFGALTDVELPPAPHNSEAERYFQLTRAALNVEPVLERPPSVVTVQTLSLMAIYQGLVADENSIESTWALMGLSSKLAQSVGLHRDCARWKLSPAEVQKRRALFWELFITDCWQALATGRLPTFSLQFVDTELPADPEETIADDGTTQPSFPAWKARWGKECVAEVVQGTLTSRAPKYTVILELDRKLRDMALPQYAQGPPPQGAGLAQTMAHFMPINYLHLTLLYVHRCFFAQALIDHPTDPLRSQYAPSFLAGYRSACAFLGTIRDQFAIFPVQIARFWVLWTHGFSSAVMLASVVTHGGTTKTAKAALGELGLAYDLFEKAAKHGGRAVKFLPIIRRLHDKAYQAYNQGLPPPRDIFTTRAAGETHDELSIFSGRTRTVATKANKPARPRSVSRRRPGVSPTSSSTTPTSPDSVDSGSGVSPSGSGSHSESPSTATSDTFPSLESYGSSVHPMLVDQMRSFQGELDAQINNVNAYYMNQQKAAAYEEQQRYDTLLQQQHEVPQQYANPPHETWYGIPQEPLPPPIVPPVVQQAPVSQLVHVDPQHFQPSTHPQDYMYGMADESRPVQQQYYSYGIPGPVPAHVPTPVSQNVEQEYTSHPQDHSQLWSVPPVEGELMYPVSSADYHHVGQSYQQVPTPSHSQTHSRQQSMSRSHSQHPQMHMMPPPPPPPVLPVQPGAYSLQETWTSFMQHELPTPVAQPPTYMRQ